MPGQNKTSTAMNRSIALRRQKNNEIDKAAHTENSLNPTYTCIPKTTSVDNEMAVYCSPQQNMSCDSTIGKVECVYDKAEDKLSSASMCCTSVQTFNNVGIQEKSDEKVSATKDQGTQIGRPRSSGKRAKQEPSSTKATAFHKRESGLRSSLKKEIKIGTYKNKLKPPVDVYTVLCSAVNGHLKKVHWKPSKKHQAIDGYKVFMSEDGKRWKLKAVCDSKTNDFVGLLPGRKIGVCSFKDNVKSELALSKHWPNSGTYKGNSSVIVNNFRGGTSSSGSCFVQRSNVKMKPLKLYKVLCTPIHLTALDRKYSWNKGESKLQKYCFSLEADIVNRILKSKYLSVNKFGVQVFLRFCLNDQSCIQEDVIPHGIVKVNKRVASAQMMDKRDGPLDITSLCKFNPGRRSENILTVEWMPNLRKSYCMTVCVAEKRSMHDIVSQLKCMCVKDQSITRDMVQHIFRFDKDVSCTSLKASLICPLGQKRLVSPCRGSNCTHIQCMDVVTLLKMNEHHLESDKKCFMCDKKLGEIYIDGLFLDLLSALPQCVNEVEFRKDGSLLIEAPGNSGPPEKKRKVVHRTFLDKNLKLPQCSEFPGDTETDIKKETENDIINAMSFHLSKLKSHLDQLDNLSDSQFTDNSMDDKINLMPCIKDEGDQNIQKCISCDIDERQKTDNGGKPRIKCTESGVKQFSKEGDFVIKSEAKIVNMTSKMSENVEKTGNKIKAEYG